MTVVDNVGSATDLATVARGGWLISTTTGLPAHSTVPTRFDIQGLTSSKVTKVCNCRTRLQNKNEADQTHSSAAGADSRTAYFVLVGIMMEPPPVSGQPRHTAHVAGERV